MNQEEFEIDLNRNEGGIPRIYSLNEAKFKLYLDQRKENFSLVSTEDIDIQKVKLKTLKRDQNHFNNGKKSPYQKWALEQVQKYAANSSDIYTFDKYVKNERKIYKSTQHLL